MINMISNRLKSLVKYVDTNDKVIDTVEDYEKGIITAEQALGQLRYKDVNHQICILNQEIIDYCLEFVESYTL